MKSKEKKTSLRQNKPALFFESKKAFFSWEFPSVYFYPFLNGFEQCNFWQQHAASISGGECVVGHCSSGEGLSAGGNWAHPHLTNRVPWSSMHFLLLLQLSKIIICEIFDTVMDGVGGVAGFNFHVPVQHYLSCDKPLSRTRWTMIENEEF